ncbi:hypothetical protein TELCIR_01924 [Teladorsagia circumcincta]|uniref:Uncharacterized protein n=1 Tax=Teladorsagia circumcincta TaxID=45464 RepID=A0A2G9V216_TELCI|nr:hypothetical protein TELCIR_01924 [Teladorsagia circumcincta]
MGFTLSNLPDRRPAFIGLILNAFIAIYIRRLAVLRNSFGRLLQLQEFTKPAVDSVSYFIMKKAIGDGIFVGVWATNNAFETTQALKRRIVERTFVQQSDNTGLQQTISYGHRSAVNQIEIDGQQFQIDVTFSISSGQNMTISGTVLSRKTFSKSPIFMDSTPVQAEDRLAAVIIFTIAFIGFTVNVFIVFHVRRLAVFQCPFGHLLRLQAIADGLFAGIWALCFAPALLLIVVLIFNEQLHNAIPLSFKVSKQRRTSTKIEPRKSLSPQTIDITAGL